jgi:hypothetical protein
LDATRVTHPTSERERSPSGVRHVPLDTDEVVFFERGLSRIAQLVETRINGAITVIELEWVAFSLADFQLEGLEAAIIEWANAEFELGLPKVDGRFDEATNRYVFSYPKYEEP